MSESQEPVCPECKAEVLYECVACSRNNYSPQRTWVGLTDEEIEQGYETTGHYQTLRPQDRFAVYALAKAIEAKLRSKNDRND